MNSVWVMGSGVVVQACNPSFGRLQEEDWEFKSSLCYKSPYLNTKENKNLGGGAEPCMCARKDLASLF